MLRLVGIGALGNMLSPAALHLNPQNSPGIFLRIYDRNPENPSRQQRRENWINHGAKIVTTYEELLCQKDYDGVVVCAGKNGDDQIILSQVIHLIQQEFNQDKKPFIIHSSTVSIEFVESAYNACRKVGIQYVNYPLTGGAKGAETGTMLILAAGDKSFYIQLEPVLKRLGKPKYFGSDNTAATKVKLVGHLMVFNGLLGMSSAIALQKKAIQLEESSSDFFDFLNQGAGGTRQWDVTLKQALSHDNWQSGFLLPHAAIDAIYTADFLIKYHLPFITIAPILQLALAFSFIMKKSSTQLATQSYLRALLDTPQELEEYCSKYYDSNAKLFLDKTISSLPRELQSKVHLDVKQEDFLECK